jgi:DNA-binding response OmpR family regulator
LEGLKIEAQTNSDLIICDLMMPMLEGYGFLKQLKQSNYSTIPVLFLTAKTELTNQQRGIDLGAKAYILRPFLFRNSI